MSTTIVYAQRGHELVSVNWKTGCSLLRGWNVGGDTIRKSSKLSIKDCREVSVYAHVTTPTECSNHTFV